MGGKADWREQERKKALLEQEAKERERRQLVDSIRRAVEEDKRALGFAALSRLPGESSTELDELLRDLRARYEPEDHIQDDALRTLAEALYRKRNREVFQKAAVARMKFGHYFNFPNDPMGASRFVEELGGAVLKKMKAICAKNSEEEEKSRETKEIDSQQAKLQDGAKPGATPSDASLKSADLADSPAATNLGQPSSIDEQKDLPPGLPDFHFEPFITKWMYDKSGELEAAYASEFGAPTADSIRVGNQILQELALAMMGDLITPECCLAELHFIEELDRTIDRSWKRFITLKNDNKKMTAEQHHDPLLPQRRGRHH